MKSLIKASLITTLLVLTSCAHHRGHNGDCKSCCAKDQQCKMKDGEQCPMKADSKEAAPATDAAAKK